MKGVFVIAFLCLAEGYLNSDLLSISITRHHKGDIFVAQGGKCYKDFCLSLSGGTAVSTGNGDCECKCTADRPVFRDDLNTCVDDIQGCSLVGFASGSDVSRVPYVFLPLKGQIVFPSADIIISEEGAPVCVVSKGQFLGRSGWLNLRNNSGTEIPFRLYKDEGRTYLQWVGESSLRMALEGRIILVHLMCKDASATEEPRIFTPCIGFRVAGNPSVKEMMFATDVHLKEEYGGGLRMREYVAIGVCSLLLAIVYVAAIFLYLHIRKRKRKQKNGNKKTGEYAQLTLGEEGVVKSNPLLQAARHLSGNGEDNAGFISESNSCCSDADQESDLPCLEEEQLLGSQNMQTSAIVHPCDVDYAETTINQDPNNIEKLPEENVSIVETLEVKDHPEMVKGMGCPNGRRKLYFNPSYFEPDLLKAPPPAAMEFLIKIREVIAIAKHKMSAKRFSPSLLGIPEEEGSSRADGCSLVGRVTLQAERVSNDEFLPNDLSWPSDTKQKIIRKWLEDVPVMILQADERKTIATESVVNKSKLWQMNEENSGNNKNNKKSSVPVGRQEKRKTKPKAPPVPSLKVDSKLGQEDVLKNTLPGAPPPPRPPPMPTFKRNLDEVPRVQGKDCVPPTIAKNLMDAVIQELTNFKKNEKNQPLQELPGKLNETLPENPTSSQREQEEATKKPEEKVAVTTNDTDSAPTGAPPQDDHEYEIILLHTDPLPQTDKKDLKIYNLPEILSKSDKTEGYSLVSEVYVNDGYSCCSGESPPSTCSNLSLESDKVHYDTPNEKPGWLTIHVNDAPERYGTPNAESENFEPDTLDRKPRRSRSVSGVNEERERYSNQKFHEMECYINSNNSENFTDSLERPCIMLKSSGTFKRNALEKDVNELFRDFRWNKAESIGSLREIYEAKSRSHRRSETTSLVDSPQGDHDRVSTLSWSEERRNKLLHRGIVLHINEEGSRRHRRTARDSPKVPSRPPKPSPTPRSRSASPAVRSACGSPLRSMSPPVPPPRSVPASPPPRSVCSPPPQPHPRSTSSSPDPRKSPASPLRSPTHTQRRHPTTPPSCASPTLPATLSTSPPPRPPKTVNSSPLLPPKNSKPPLPPKNLKRHPKPNKFAGRPLPPLPRPGKDYSSSPIPCRDPETLSTLSGASMDSLNSSDYEAFYTLPYEDDDPGSGSRENSFKKSRRVSSVPVATGNTRVPGHRSRDSWTKTKRQRPEDSGYLSTDSDSCCPQLMLSSHFSRIPETPSQNSETEESLCDGASESGGESIATDSFFYGNFKKTAGRSDSGSGPGQKVRPYTLRLSDVEVNSDTERHCVPIMVRP